MGNLINIDGKPIEKLIQVVSQGIGILYEPRRIRKKADAEAYRAEKIEEAKAKALIFKHNAQLTISERAQNRMMISELDRQINIEAIVDKVVKYLPEQVSDTNVDGDWRKRFFNKCQDVSNEDLQEMWAKILADEITEPGAISLRTLDVLSNLVASECKLFEKFISMSFTNIGIYHPYERIYNKFGLIFSDILKLSAAHLIHETEISSPLGYRAEIDGGIIIFDEKYYSVKKKDNEGVAFDVIKLTPEGQQLAKISNFKYNHDYLVEFFRTIKERGYSYKEIDAEIISSLSRYSKT